ncbi:MAG: mechanosensitive ion channel family protein [bacterium]
MAQPPAVNDIPSALSLLGHGLQQVTTAWQLGAIAVALAFAWAVKLWLQPRLDRVEGRWKSSVAGLERALFPVSGLLLLLPAHALLAEWNPTALLGIASSLLAALAIVRVLAWLMRSAFNASPAIDAWERLIGWTVWIGVALHLTGVLPAITRILDSVTIPMGKGHVSVLLMMRGTLSVVLTLLVALWIGRLIEARLMGAQAMDINVRVIFAKAAKALLIVIGVLVALSVVGIDITLLSVFGGALGVGLGFGLQKIASNYVSGFIILADRSVSIGNTVVIDNREGVVTRMTGRYVVVRSLDGNEAIIPNETIITSTVINQSYSDPKVRIAVPIQIAYESDLEAVIELIRRVAARNPRVLEDPAPTVLVRLFGESGIELELGAWVGDPDCGRNNLRSDLYRELWQTFREHGVRIPYPQREVRLLGPDLPEQPSARAAAAPAGSTPQSEKGAASA